VQVVTAGSKLFLYYYAHAFAQGKEAMHPPGGVPTAYSDNFARSLLAPKEFWPSFDYSAQHIGHCPDRINVSAALLDAAITAGVGDLPFLFYRDVMWTYRHLLERVERLARVLVEDLGLKPGNRVLLRSYNNPMLAACWLAVIRANVACARIEPDS
jgi:2-aminobenzoate-CoA ligase